jgi:outer membrane protein
MNRKAFVILCILISARWVSALTLHEAVERTLARSPGLGAAESARDEAAASVRLARDAFHPEAWASTTPGYSSGLPVAIAGRVPAIAGLDVRQTLYDGSARSEIFQSEAQAAARGGDAEKSRRETARAAVLLYARCWSDERRIAAARRRQGASESILDHAGALFREGRRTELELERARLEAARARQKALDAESDRDLDFRELRIAIGADPGSSLEIADDPLVAIGTEPAGVDPTRLRDSDPTLRALELELDSLRRSAAIAGAAISPVVEAEGQYSRLSRANHYDRYYRSFKADDWSIGVSIAVPLWSGGRAADARARLESRIAVAEADRRGRQASLDLAAARAESALDRANAASSLAQRAEGVSSEALRLSESLYREGRTEPDEVERRKIELSDSEEETLRARLEWLTARCDLLSLSGEIAGFGR